MEIRSRVNNGFTRRFRRWPKMKILVVCIFLRFEASDHSFPASGFRFCWSLKAGSKIKYPGQALNRGKE